MGDYIVYEHVFPNGKRYIGISKNGVSRWRKDGKGYKAQTKIAKAIEHFGWDNIEHNIILKNLSHDQANRCEAFLIDLLDTIENGYNITKGGDGISKSYLNSRVLKMLRLSDKMDKAYGESPQPGDIISICRKGNDQKNVADMFNAYDTYIGIFYSHVFRLPQFRKCEEYWYYMRIMFERSVSIIDDIPTFYTYVMDNKLDVIIPTELDKLSREMRTEG